MKIPEVRFHADARSPGDLGRVRRARIAQPRPGSSTSAGGKGLFSPQASVQQVYIELNRKPGPR
jgi:hypothetical protein